MRIYATERKNVLLFSFRGKFFPIYMFLFTAAGKDLVVSNQSIFKSKFFLYKINLNCKTQRTPKTFAKLILS